eukprot:1155836-Pelagomonas_calceolata.AAC.1
MGQAGPDISCWWDLVPPAGNAGWVMAVKATQVRTGERSLCAFCWEWQCRLGHGSEGNAGENRRALCAHFVGNGTAGPRVMAVKLGHGSVTQGKTAERRRASFMRILIGLIQL